VQRSTSTETPKRTRGSRAHGYETASAGSSEGEQDPERPERSGENINIGGRANELGPYGPIGETSPGRSRPTDRGKTKEGVASALTCKSERRSYTHGQHIPG